MIDLAAEVKFMAATVKRDDFPDLPVVAIKLAGMAGGDIEKSIDADAFHGGRARRRNDIHAGILKSERRAGERLTGRAIIAEPAGKEQRGRSAVGVVDRDALNGIGD